MNTQQPNSRRGNGLTLAWVMAFASLLACQGAWAQAEVEAGTSHRTAEHVARTALHFDYELAHAQAMSKKRSGLRKLFWFTGTPVCKGGVLEEHSQVLLNALSLWGDEAFSRELAGEPQPLQRSVIAAVDSVSPKSASRISTFPKTYALRIHPR